MTETKATFAMARTLAQLARVHLREKQPAEAKRAFELARTAFTNARTEPPVCRGFEDFGGEGTGTKGVTQHLPRFWKAAGGVRVGASYWVIDPVELFAGVGFDASAVPLATLDPTLYDANKMSFSLGGRFLVHRRLAIGLTVTDILYFKADNRGKGVINKFKSPTRQASADGIYKSNILLTNLYFDVMF